MILTVAIVLWLVPRNDPDSRVGAVVFAAFKAIAMMALIVWAVAWRPLVRAEKANLAKAGGEPPSKRDPSNWVIAWLIAWPNADDLHEAWQQHDDQCGCIHSNIDTTRLQNAYQNDPAWLHPWRAQYFRRDNSTWVRHPRISSRKRHLSEPPEDE